MIGSLPYVVRSIILYFCVCNLFVAPSLISFHRTFQMLSLCVHSLLSGLYGFHHVFSRALPCLLPAFPILPPLHSHAVLNVPLCFSGGVLPSSPFPVHPFVLAYLSLTLDPRPTFHPIGQYLTMDKTQTLQNNQPWTDTAPCI